MDLHFLRLFDACAGSSGNPFSYRPWMNETGAAAHKAQNLKNMLAGALTGAVEITTSYPVEFIKTQLQLDEKGENKKYNGIIDCIRKVYKEKGPLGFYRGLSILFIGSMPKYAIRFGAFEFLKQKLTDKNGHITSFKLFFAGLCAGVSEALILVTPMETIRVKLVNDQRLPNPQFKGLIHGIGKIISKDGLNGIYKGATPTMLKHGSNQAIRFGIVEACKAWYKGDDPKKHVPPLKIGLFGVFAGVMSIFGNNPFDLIKTRMQGLEAAKYKNTIDCFLKVWKDEGPLAFYKGTTARLSRVVIEVPLSFIMFQIFKDLLDTIVS